MAEIISVCFFHGNETWPADAYRVCGECGHVYEAAFDLERSWAGMYERMGEPLTKRVNADDIPGCPICGHDF